MVPPAATVPAESESAYLNLRMEGTATLAMVAAVAMEDPETAAMPPQAATVGVAGVEDRETRKIERLHGVFGEKAPLHGVSQAVAKGKRAQQGEIAIPRVGGDGGNHEGVDQGREVGGDVAKKWTDNTDHLFFRDERTQGLSGTGHGAL